MGTPVAMPKRGDVLILGTTKSVTVYAVGRIMRDGEQHFYDEEDVIYSRVRATAEAEAKALVTPGHRIYFRDLDTGEWSEILP